MELNDLRVYKISMEIGAEVWKITRDWDDFSKNTIGKQLVRSADSIAANISEGFGRYHYRDSRMFYYYARGSLFETTTWLRKANQRSLVSDEGLATFEQSLKDLGVKLNNYITSIKVKTKSNKIMRTK
jgi:four helix bundle protein